MDAVEISEYETVKQWGRSLAEHWGGDPLAEDPDKLAALIGFCAAVGKNPDELVAFCFLRKKGSGEVFASKKRREKVLAELGAHCSACGLARTETRRLRSNVLSFLTHNGVLV